MKKIRILLVDPRHDTVGTHSNYVPINIAYIASSCVPCLLMRDLAHFVHLS